MNTDTSMLGRCPECDERVPRASLLVEYDRDDGTVGMWAECPACASVVDPR